MTEGDPHPEIVMLREKSEAHERRMDGFENKLDRIEKQVNTLPDRIGERLERRFADVNARAEAANTKAEASSQQRSWTKQDVLLAVMVVVTIAGTLTGGGSLWVMRDVELARKDSEKDAAVATTRMNDAEKLAAESKELAKAELALEKKDREGALALTTEQLRDARSRLAAAEDRSGANAQHIAEIVKKLDEVETQFFWQGDVESGERADTERVLRLLWKRATGEDLPAKNPYQRGPQKHSGAAGAAGFGP